MLKSFITIFTALLIFGTAVCQSQTASTADSSQDSKEVTALLAELGLTSLDGTTDSISLGSAAPSASLADRQAGVSWQYQRIADIAAPYSNEQRQQLEQLLRTISEVLNASEKEAAELESTTQTVGQLTEISPGSVPDTGATDSNGAFAIGNRPVSSMAPVEAVVAESESALTEQSNAQGLNLSDWILRLKVLLAELEESYYSHQLN